MFDVIMMTIGGNPFYQRWAYWYRALIVVTDRLAELVASGAPMPAGLEALAEDAPSRRIAHVLRELRDDLIAGHTLHEAMAREERFFPRYYVETVRAGEESGQVYACLTGLGDHLVESIQFKERVSAYAFYLGLVLLSVAMVTSGLFAFVLPQFREIFGAMAYPLPPMSRFLVTARELGLHYVLLAVPIAGYVVLFLYFMPAGRAGDANTPINRFLRRLPYTGAAQTKTDLAQAAMVLHLMLSRGTPLVRALTIVTELDLGGGLRDAFKRVRNRCEHGATLRDAVQPEKGILPESFCGLLSLGESSGRLPAVLRQIALLYRREAMRTRRVALEVMAPVGLCVIGLVVFLIYGGFFQAIFSLSQTVQQPF